jgi:zinc-ribbon domain
MFCNQCGAQLTEGAGFCGQCGKAQAAPPTAPAVPAVARPAYVDPVAGRVERHRQILAVLWLVLGLLGLVGGWALMVIAQAQPWLYGGGAENMPPFAPTLVHEILFGIGVALLAFSALRIITAVGLFAVQSWARVLAIVMAIISLIEIPIGTAIGIYTLWVLVPRQAEVEYAAMAQAKATGARF